MAETKASVLKRTISGFSSDQCMTMAAALAYYSVFALPGLLVLIILLVGLFVDPGAVQGKLQGQVQGFIGPQGAAQLTTMMEHANRPGAGLVGGIVGFLTLAFGATGVMIQLQTALNNTWGVEPDPEAGGFRNFISKRLLSFGMVLTLAFLLLVSLVLSAVLAAFGHLLGSMLPGDVSRVLLGALDFAVSFSVITVLFAAMLKFLPDAEVAWKDVWLGAAVTALLFSIGKFALGWYLGRQDVNTTFGAAGSLVLILLWTYYSSAIFLLGSEFTQAWATRGGGQVQPEEGAVRVVRQHQRAANE